MKTLINILTGILAIALIPAYTAAQLSEKLYQVTDDGRFQFIYWQFTGAPKGVVHPITPRTFYLETKRQGLISENLRFADFLELPRERLQAMMDFSQAGVIAAMNKKAAFPIDEGDPAISVSVSDEFPKDASLERTSDETGADIEIPWLVKAITHPRSVQGIPEIYASEEKHDFPLPAKARKIPWIVRVMLIPETLDHYEETEIENAQATNSGKTHRRDEKFFVKDLYTHRLFQNFTRGMQNAQLSEAEPSRAEDFNEQADRRVRLLILLNHLMAYQDDEVQRKYGKVYPAIEGKLYGTSDAELDEILSALLNMKDDFLADARPEVSEIFNELEALAFGR